MVASVNAFEHTVLVAFLKSGGSSDGRSHYGYPANGAVFNLISCGVELGLPRVSGFDSTVHVVGNYC